MSKSFADESGPDFEKLAADLDQVEEVSERVRLAGLALAAPLADLRQAQLAREATRASARYGADDPEAVQRAAALKNAEARFGRLRSELARTRVTPAVPEEGAAAISGIVSRGGVPVADATVSALLDEGRAGFVCTNDAGGFALPVPADAPIRLSVSLKAEGELFRDRMGLTLQPGQSVFRHIELEGAARPCTEPSEDTPPPDTTFPMIDLRGQFEADARKLIHAHGLVLGDRSEKEDREQAGRVIDQSPQPGAAMKTDDSVSIVVATDGSVEVPQLLGLTREDARLVLAKAELNEGEITRREAPRELDGRIVGQSPEPGKRVARRSAIDLEIGIAGGQSAPAEPKPEVARVASLAAHRLTERSPEADEGESEKMVEARLARAKVRRLSDLDKLLAGDREEARDRLGLRTLAETDRFLSALRRARKELDG